MEMSDIGKAIREDTGKVEFLAYTYKQEYRRLKEENRKLRELAAVCTRKETRLTRSNNDLCAYLSLVTAALLVSILMHLL